MKIYWLLFFLFGILTLPGADLVKNGKACASIVLPAHASEVEKFAAEELAEYIEKMTGVKLPAAKTPIQGLLPIRFGLNSSPDLVMTPALNKALDSLKQDGFVLEAGKNGIQIVAKYPAGIHYGNYYILKKYGGIYWFHPDTEEDVPKKKDFIVPDQLTVKIPMRGRQGVPSGNGAMATPEVREAVALWNMRNGLPLNQRNPGKEPEQTAPGNYYKNSTVTKLGHSLKGYGGGHIVGECINQTPVDPNELKKEMERIKKEEITLFQKKRIPSIRAYAQFNLIRRTHPEYFGIVDGKRVPTGIELRTGDDYLEKSSMPCLSNPATRKQFIQNLLDFKEKHYNGMEYVFTLSCDDQSQWCECDECMKLLKSKGSKGAPDKASDYWWDFVNYVSGELAKYPEITLNVLAYRDYQEFPEKIKPIPRKQMNLIIACHGRCYLHSLHDPDCKMNSKYRKMLERWSGMGMPVSTFEYMSQTPGKSNYAFWERAWINDIKWFMKSNIAHTSGGLTGPWAGYSTDDSYYRRNAAKSRWQIAWLTGYFEWNPEDDFDTVRNELFSRYYGRAWPVMKEYRELLETALRRTGQCMAYGASGTLFASAYATPGLAVRAKELLNLADKAAGNDKVLLKRIAMDREYFRSNWESSGIREGDAGIIRIEKAEKSPLIDGKLDECAWIKAPVFNQFFRIQGSADTPRKGTVAYQPLTNVKFLYDDKNLYLGIEAFKIDGKVKDIPADGSDFQAMNGSHLEFEIMSPALKGKYYHLALSHNGLVYSALTENGRSRDFKNKLDFEYKILDFPDRWTAEIRIPAEKFGGITDGTLWKMDLARSAVGKHGKRNGIGTLSGYGMHLPDYWNVFSFGGGGNLILNGSFEELDELKNEKGNGKNWIFPSKKMPVRWFFQQNGGIAEIGRENAADGTCFLRIGSPKPGWPAFILQDVNAFDPDVKQLRVSMKLRGKGIVTPSLLMNGKEKAELQFTVNDGTRWTEYYGVLKLNDCAPKKLMIRVQGSAVEMDDVRITAEKEGR